MANFGELRYGEVQHSPTPIRLGPPARTCSTVGYYAPEQWAKPVAFLGVWGGAKRRPRQARWGGLAQPVRRAPIQRGGGSARPRALLYVTPKVGTSAEWHILHTFS